MKIPDGLPDEKVIFLSDIFPTGYMGAENCNIQPDDTVAIWGCGPVAQFAIRSAFMLGAERVIAIDRVPERLQMAKEGGAETLNFEEVERPRSPQGHDRQSRSRLLHGRCRHGGNGPRPLLLARPRKAGGALDL